MNIYARVTVLVAILARCIGNEAAAQEAWSIYAVRPTTPVTKAINNIAARWGAVPKTHRWTIASIDVATFCARLRESDFALYVATADDYRQCYPEVPISGAFDFPYSTNSWSSKIKIADGPVGTAYVEGLNRLGIHVMAFWTGDTSIIVSSARIERMSDFKGLAVHVPESFSSQIFVSENGGKAVPSAESTRLNLLNSPSTPVAVQVPLDRYVLSDHIMHKNVLLSGSTFNPVVVATPEKAWDSLPAVRRSQLEGLIRDVTEAERNDALELANHDIQQLKQQGKNIAELSAAELAAFNQKARQQASVSKAVQAFANASQDVRQASVAQATGTNSSPYAHVLFVTNRNFDDRFSTSAAGKNLSYGAADVELAYASPNPVVEGANRLIRYLTSGGGVRVDWKNVSSTPISDSFFNVATQVPTKAPLVFVHGFANDFKDALQGAAWIEWNSKRPVIVFSWPSIGHVTVDAYHKDQHTADNSEDMLAQFLGQLRKGDDKETDIDIVVHSMGARLLLGALEKIESSDAKAKPPKFRQLLLVAPDVPQAQLHREWPELHKYFKNVGTLYSSDHDRALILSKKFLNVRAVPRAGLAPPVEVEQKIESVFVGDDEFSVTGHSYLTANGPAATDIMELLRYATKAEDRTGCTSLPDGGGYYVLRSVVIP
ncbi:alpha/beta hydrolase [Paraburkholderia strydomiana]|jgi:esterase/lipase superfamily enzyme/TRAP-type C4-dicarboxylate transport system substrate-binding protein|uniref:Alpha/beta hydrolase n=1 Tax=Paraburkholderia strydomiana TaxID=1245417 RepID=A0ABW9EEV5_9BURK